MAPANRKVLQGSCTIILVWTSTPVPYHQGLENALRRVKFHGLGEIKDDPVHVFFKCELPTGWDVSVLIVMVHVLQVEIATLNGLHGSPLGRVIQHVAHEGEGSAIPRARASSPIHPSYFAFTVPVHFGAPVRYLLAARSESLSTNSRRNVAIAGSRFLLAMYTMRRR